MANVTAPVLADGSATYTPRVSRKRLRSSARRKYYGADRLGTYSVETNASQAISSSKVFDAFGNLVSSTGSSASPFGYGGAYGYQSDADSGLKLWATATTTPPPAASTRDPARAGRNWYTYAENRPTKKVDPLGLDPMEDWKNGMERYVSAIPEKIESGGRTWAIGGAAVTTRIPTDIPYASVAGPRPSTKTATR